MTDYFTVNRRCAQHAISDFLCREIPVLSPSDIAQNTQIMEAQLIGAAPGFRGDISCMTCHVTMDLAARTTRNVFTHQMTGSDNGPIGDLNSSGKRKKYEKPALYHRPNIGLTPEEIMARLKPSLIEDDFIDKHETYYWESKIPYYPASEPRGAFVFKDFMAGQFIKTQLLE